VIKKERDGYREEQKLALTEVSDPIKFLPSVGYDQEYDREEGEKQMAHEVR
jgi:hypothetical protein